MFAKLAKYIGLCLSVGPTWYLPPGIIYRSVIVEKNSALIRVSAVLFALLQIEAGGGVAYRGILRMIHGTLVHDKRTEFNLFPVQ